MEEFVDFIVDRGYFDCKEKLFEIMNSITYLPISIHDSCPGKVILRFNEIEIKLLMDDADLSKFATIFGNVLPTFQIDTFGFAHERSDDLYLHEIISKMIKLPIKTTKFITKYLSNYFIETVLENIQIIEIVNIFNIKDFLSEEFQPWPNLRSIIVIGPVIEHTFTWKEFNLLIDKFNGIQLNNDKGFNWCVIEPHNGDEIKAEFNCDNWNDVVQRYYEREWDKPIMVKSASKLS